MPRPSPRKLIALLVIVSLAIGITVANYFRQPKATIVPLTVRSNSARSADSASNPVNLSTNGKDLNDSGKSFRAAFRQASDYHEFVGGIRHSADAGDPVAEFLVAKALRYCADNLRMFLAIDGTRRTLDEVQVRMAQIPGAFERSNEVYRHCHTYLENPALAPLTADWKRWLDSAATAGYPPAITEKADVMRVADLMKDAAGADAGDVIPPTEGPARELALAAVKSGDPDSILGMVNWVDGTKRNGEANFDLESAWELLACRRGYDDCGANSELVRSVCMFDAQCQNDAGVIESLRRRLGNRFDDVDRLATEIGVAVDSGSSKAIEAFL